MCIEDGRSVHVGRMRARNMDVCVHRARWAGCVHREGEGIEHKSGQVRVIHVVVRGDRGEDNGGLCACGSGEAARRGHRWAGGVMCIEDGDEGAQRHRTIRACIHVRIGRARAGMRLG